MLQSAVLGGLFIGVLSALPIVNVGNCCCLWILGGGALSVYLLQQRELLPIGALRGAVVGLLAGIVGAFVWLIASLVLDQLVTPLQERMVAAMIHDAQDMPPDVRAWFDSIGARASSPVRFVVGFLFQLLAGGVFSMLGGLLGSSMIHPEVPPLPHLHD